MPNLKVGYVMGIGDQVPIGLQQLGATVTLLGERDLATADLSVYDAIVTGTRAYAVRDDLKTYNKRLLDYVKAGGNMIVLYNTFELVPNQFAPFPGELLASAEEVSEEDSPVTILAPTEQSFNWPNKITLADFDGWVEQRGSKFFTTWDKAYTPMISTFDKGQPPQSGGWLTAQVRQRALDLLRATRCTVSCRTACPARIGSRRTCWRWERRRSSVTTRTDSRRRSGRRSTAPARRAAAGTPTAGRDGDTSGSA